ncbi:MAG: AI-2E family transporter [Anaerolineae bacterium]
MKLPSWLMTPKLRWRAVLIASLVVLTCWVLISGWKALLPFFLGLILTYLLLPIVHLFDRIIGRLIRRKMITRTLSITIVFILSLALIVFILFNFVPVISSQLSALLRAIPTLYGRVIQLLRTDWPDFVSRIPPEFQEVVNSNLNQAVNEVLNAVQRGVLATVTIITQTISFILGLMLIPFWLFIVMQDEDKVWRGFYSLVPAGARDDTRYLIQIIDHSLHAYVRSQLLGLLLVWAITTVTLLAMNIDLAMLWGTLAGLMQIVPFVGPYIAAIPPIIWTFAYRPQMAIWVIVAYVAIQNILGLLVMPRISGDATRIHPAIIMILVLVGAQVAGFWGVLLCVPLAAVIRDVFHYLYLRTTEHGNTPQEAIESFRANTAKHQKRVKGRAA